LSRSPPWAALISSATGRADKRARGAAAPSHLLALCLLFPVFEAALFLSHWTLLRLPYYWDEGGYYIPAALDLFRTGSVIPHSTLTNAHPPLPSLLLAAWWSLFGFHILATRTLMTLIAAAALLAVFRLARELAGTGAAVAVTLLTAIYPVWFAQTTLAQADLFAAAFTLWALTVYFTPASRAPNRRLLCLAGCFTLAALAKETAIVTPVCLVAWEAWLLLRRQRTQRTQADQPGQPGHTQHILAALLAPILPLVLWYAYHWHTTGFIFGNPEFLRYNATANLNPVRILTSLWHRAVHLLFHMNLWAPALLSVALLFSPPLPDRRARGLPASAVKALLVVILGNAIAFSILGGALLTRYLLPVYPLELLLAVALWQQRMRWWPLLAGLTAAGFLAALFINPPYSIAPEDNLTYRDMIVLHQQATAFVAGHYPQATVLTAWPATSELTFPELGYVRRPVKVDALENFSYEQIQRAAADPGGYDTALVFSTKWIPPAGLPNLGLHTEATDRAFYDFHRDLSPHEIALALHGDIVWQAARNGEWAAVLRFPRIVEARLR
jgi:4-amino-4-deoxy-L-arabinose transferase-like glycosyltransferase